LRCIKWVIENHINDIGLIVSSSKDIQNAPAGSGVCFLEYTSDEDIITQLGGGEEIFDLGILIWWPKIIKAPIINFVRNGFISTHPSLLPYNKSTFPK
jgi:methionyl-tRNA formyltransferase